MATLSFLEDVRSTEDGYLWIQSEPNQRNDPPLLPCSQHLWRTLHSPVAVGDTKNLTVAAKKNNKLQQPFDTRQLVRSRGLEEIIRSSITEIEHMKDCKAADKFMHHRRQSVNRLKKQQTARLNLATAGRQEMDRIEEQAYSTATLRTVKTLNSIRAIFPLLIRMFHHEDKENRNLEVYARNEDGELLTVDDDEQDGGGGGVGVVVTLQTLTDERSKKKRKSLVWLLGDYVYDVATRHQFFLMNECLWRVLECLATERQIFRLIDLKDASESFWATLLPNFVDDQRARRRHVPSPMRLFDDLPREGQARVLDTARACDERFFFVFHHKNEDAQRTRVLYQAAVDRLIANLRFIIQGRYRGSEVRVYGSCLSNLSLGKSSDVDISLHLPAFAHMKQLFETGQVSARVYEKEMKNHVHRTNGLLRSQSRNGFRMRECVTQARVPVIKGTFLYAGNPYSPDGSVDFDICFANEIAIVNSALLSEYTLVDDRVKCFLLSVKAWARHYQLSSAADSGISSYAWVNLGIFYLQCIGFVPNLQCRDLMAQHGFELDPAVWFNNVNDLMTGFMRWQHVAAQNVWTQPMELKDTPVTMLVYGFFHFYTKHFPTSLFAVSVREGSIKLPRASFRKAIIQKLCIEDPFETHCSYVPHDLAAPAGDKGYQAIEEVMCESELLLRHTLTESIDAGHSFWRLCDVAEPPIASILNSTTTMFPGSHAVAHKTQRGRQSSSKESRRGVAHQGRGDGNDSRSTMKRPTTNSYDEHFEEEKKSTSGDFCIMDPGEDGEAHAGNDKQTSIEQRPIDVTGPSTESELAENTFKQTRTDRLSARTLPKPKGADRRSGGHRSNRNRHPHGKDRSNANGAKPGSGSDSKKDTSTAQNKDPVGANGAIETSDKPRPSRVRSGPRNRTKKSFTRGGQVGSFSGFSRRNHGKNTNVGVHKNTATNGKASPAPKQGTERSKPAREEKQ